MSDMVLLEDVRQIVADPIDSIWNEFQVIVTELELPFLGKVYLQKMVEFFADSLHRLKQEKCNKLEQNQRCIGQLMICEMCSDLYVEPVTLVCGHTYCRKCLQKRESYIELCIKCDKNSLTRSRWCLFRQSLLDKYRTNVILHAIIQENYPDELRAITLRLEGNEYFAKKDLDNAKAKYQEAVTICPTSFMSWSNLSLLRTSQNMYADALQAAQKSISICPFWAKGYYHEGVAFRGLSNKLASALSFFKYLILEPSSVPTKDKFVENMTEILATEAPSAEELKERMKSVERVMKAILEKGFEFSLANTPNNMRYQKLNNQLSIENLRNRFTCALCCRIFYKATTTPCGHTYCTLCVERSLDYNHVCSICRSPLAELITIKPKPIDTIIETLVQKYFPDEYEESQQASIVESSTLRYETDDIARIPVFVCMAAFPTLECPLHIFEPRYKLMMRRCLDAPEKVFGMCMFDEVNGFREYGVLMKIRDSKMLDDGRLLVDTIGGTRFKVLERGTRDGYDTARVRILRDNPSENREGLRELQKHVYEESESFLNIIPSVIRHTVQLKYGDLPKMEEPGVDELSNEHGSRWLWFMIRILVHDGDETENALKCDSVEQRLLLVRQSIIRMKGLANS